MKIGIIGAGFIGRAAGELAVRNGHDVMISNSRDPKSLGSTVGMLQHKGKNGTITAGTPTEAAAFGEVVLVSIPLNAYRSLPVDALAGKIVLDTINYYFERDGNIKELDDGTQTTGTLLQQFLPRSKVVKFFNAIPAFEIEDGKPAGTPGRRALPISGNDADAKKVASELLDAFGFDVVDAGPLAEDRRFARGTPAYCVNLDKAALTAALAQA